MKKETKATDDQDMLPEYDLAKMGPWVRGKYAERMKLEKGSYRALLAPDTAKVFGNGEAANEALRLLIRIAENDGLSESKNPNFDFTSAIEERDVRDGERIVRLIPIAPDVAKVFKDEK